MSEEEDRELTELAIEIRCAVPICHCGRIVGEGENHWMCYPGME